MNRITDSFVTHAQQHPEQLAIALGPQTVTYGELLQRVEQVAGAIAPLTQDHSPRIGILLPNCIEFLELFLGSAMSGGIAMVLNPDWAQPQIQAIVDRWPPYVLVSKADQLQAVAKPVGMQAIAITPESPDFPSYIDWRNYTSANSPHPQPGEAPFYIGFTSGTTGHPKGILRTHASWLHSFAASRVEFNINPTDHVLAPGSLVHSLSLYTAIETLAMGASLHILPTFSPKAILTLLNTAPITRLVAVPTLLKAIATAAQNQTFPYLKTVIVGGSKLSPTLRQQLATIFLKSDILEYYGASELSFVSIASSCESVPPESVGRPFHSVTVSVQKDDGSGAADIGEIGWIGVRSSMICSGYLEPQTSNGFRYEQGWATVGDRGYLDAHGYLYLVGRERDMLISNGINVYPSEIEAVLLQLPQIENAVVLGLPDDCRGDLICAVLTWNGSEHLKRPTLIHHIHTHLDRAKCPRRFFAVDSLPITSSGKIARSQLQAHILQGALAPSELRA